MDQHVRTHINYRRALSREAVTYFGQTAYIYPDGSVGIPPADLWRRFVALYYGATIARDVSYVAGGDDGQGQRLVVEGSRATLSAAGAVHAGNNGYERGHPSH